MNKAEQAEDFQASLRGQVFGVGQGGARNRMQHVQRDRVGVEVFQGEGQIDQVFVGFSHADNAARTQFQSGGARVLQGGHSIPVCVGRADGGVIGLARVQIVVDAIDARGFESFGLGFGQESQGTADLHRKFLFDPLHRGGDVVHFFFERAPSADHHAVPFRLGFMGTAGGLEHVLR